MKKIRYTLLASCLFALCGCGTTDVWKDWEDQGTMNEETRLRPSEVKKLLCAADGWKLSYEGVDFYLQFDENGNVITNTNEKILRPELEAQYHLDFKGEQTVLLTLAGNTSLQYLKNNQESTFLISSYASDLIAATGQAHGLTMNLSPVTTADLAANRETKAAILHRVEALENISCGAIREKGGDILAYYTLSSDNDNNWSMQLTDIADGKVVHTNHALVLNVEDDRLGVVTAPGLDIKGHALKSITYDYDGATQPVIGNGQPRLRFQRRRLLDRCLHGQLEHPHHRCQGKQPRPLADARVATRDGQPLAAQPRHLPGQHQR